jgi:hypothetical protein
MEILDAGAWISIISGIVSVAGAIAAIYVLITKMPSDRRKTDSDSFAAIAEASESIASGAKVSNEFLRDQISELKKRDKEREEKLKEVEDRLITGEKINLEIRRELIAWQDWAKRLSHQVISLGGSPVPFRPKMIDDFADKDLSAE